MIKKKHNLILLLGLTASIFGLFCWRIATRESSLRLNNKVSIEDTDVLITESKDELLQMHPPNQEPLQNQQSSANNKRDDGGISKCNVTLVTSLFDIHREEVAKDKRSFADFYIHLIKQLIVMNAPIVLFTTPNVKLILDEYLSNNETKNFNKAKLIVARDTFPLAYTTSTVASIFNSPFKKKIPKNAYAYVANAMPAYNPLMYSKFVFLDDAIALNPFQTSHFFWIDAGLTRLLYPSDRCEEFVLKKCDSDRVQIGGNAFGYWKRPKKKTSPEAIRNHFIGTNLDYLWGGFFGGRSETVLRLNKLVLHEYFEEMLKKNRVDTEQLALLLVWFYHDDVFDVHIEPEPGTRMETFNYIRLAQNSTC